MKQVEITLVKSLIGQNEKQRATVQALGLRKIRQSIVREDSPSLRGMIDKVGHLVQYKVIEA
ncbi:50S ribosomal protein L30 [Ferroacidibacillus organovorans]|uniref:Large ribosomal subunit protein uL30 n=1 Tax=Ferroacidibacillus organovorans TaxID=1765683 RepID=A0A162SBH3_9BACL|nr:50S ribosomal protein L30 [Ferroacidibacillus organovorans]KYP79680.1 50S ribosomal protein L30 [Ferroacidibacillus organovorans]OAG94818.1 50S ribosomal protein L30 [Ferroacidibacillus organovorans]OPG17038.1 50S ribosomal protein L30 [Ferroacidibacillus organovorans]